MCCSGEEQKTESKTSVPDWLMNGYQRLFQRAEAQSQKPYRPYTGPRVAGFTPDQQDAFQKVRDNFGVAQPYYDAAYASAQQGAAPVTWQQVEAAYNPTIAAQIQRMRDDFDTQNAREAQRSNAMATNAGVITGDRAQVARVLTEESQRRQQDPIIAGILSQSYDRAWQGAEGNRDAAARGAQIYGQLGGQVQDSVGEDIQRLLAIGGAQQQNQQANYDWRYQQYLDKQRYPYQNIQWATGIAGVGPSFGMTSSGTTQQNDSLLGNVMGLGATALGAYLSDERAKENIVPIGKTHDGQTIYRYNYVGDPTTQIGLIAQEVEVEHPEAVTEGRDGLKRVNYDLATRDAAPHKTGEGGFAYGGQVQTRMSDDEFKRLVGKVDTAVRSMRGHMEGGRAGYDRGGFVVPVAEVGKDAAPTSFVPDIPLQAASPASPSQAPAMSPRSQGGAWDALGQGANKFGKWLGSSDPTNPSSWKTVVTPAARGGVIGGLEEDDPLNSMTFPVVKADSSFASPTVVQRSRPSGVPGIELHGEGVAPRTTDEAPRTYNAPATSTLGEPYTLPEPASAMAPDASLAQSQSASDGVAWYEPHAGKQWFDQDSNPDLGLALASAGAAMLANRGSAFSKLGRGVGTGVGTYLARAADERKQQREDRELELRASELADQGALRRIQMQKAKSDLAEANLGKVVEVDKKAFLLKPDGTREVIYDGGQSQKLGPWENIKDKTNAEESLRKDFNSIPTVKDFMTMRDAYNRVLASSETPDAAGDIALIYAYMKILDPGSVVRETEFATAQNAAGVPDQIRNVWNKLLDGTRLGPEESALRQQFVDRAKLLYGAQNKQYESVRKYYGEIADRQGLDKENVLVDHTRVNDPNQNRDRAINDARELLRRGVDPREVYDALRKDGIDPSLLGGQ